jgi:hypothetical protein
MFDIIICLLFHDVTLKKLSKQTKYGKILAKQIFLNELAIKIVPGLDR